MPPTSWDGSSTGPLDAHSYTYVTSAGCSPMGSGLEVRVETEAEMAYLRRENDLLRRALSAVAAFALRWTEPGEGVQEALPETLVNPVVDSDGGLD